MNMFDIVFLIKYNKNDVFCKNWLIYDEKITKNKRTKSDEVQRSEHGTWYMVLGISR